MDIWVVPTFYLQIMLPWTLVYKILYRYMSMFSNLLVINLGVKLLGRMFDFSRNCQAVVQSSCIVLHSYEQCMKVPIFLPPHDFFWIITSLVVWNGIAQCSRFNLKSNGQKTSHNGHRTHSNGLAALEVSDCCTSGAIFSQWMGFFGPLGGTWILQFFTCIRASLTPLYYLPGYCGPEFGTYLYF